MLQQVVYIFLLYSYCNVNNIILFESPQYYDEKSLTTTVSFMNHVRGFLLFFLLTPTLFPPPPHPPCYCHFSLWHIRSAYIYVSWLHFTPLNFRTYSLYHVPTGSFQPLHRREIIHTVRGQSYVWRLPKY